MARSPKRIYYEKLLFVSLAFCGMLFASCSTTTPISATSNPVGNKCGEVKTHRILGFGGSADLGINKAAKKAGITRISHVDQYSKTFLGIYTTIGVRVYGE